MSTSLTVGKSAGQGGQLKGLVLRTSKFELKMMKIEQKMKQLSNQSFQPEVKVKDSGSGVLKKMQKHFSSIKGEAAKKVIFEPIEVADSLKATEIEFSALLGSQKKAKSFMKDLNNYSVSSPFDQGSIISYSKEMLNLGWNQKNVLKDLSLIGDQTTAVGTGSKGIEQIISSFGKMKSTGKASISELNNLTMSNVKAWEYVAKGEGVSVKKAQEMVERGAIPANKAIRSILKGMEEFDGTTSKIANGTVGGLKDQIKETFQTKLVDRWGKGLQKGAVSGLSRFLGFLDKISPKLDEWGGHLESLGESISTGLADKLASIGTRLTGLFSSKEFQQADLFGKMDIAWDKLIAEPFGEWWNSTGKEAIASKVKSISEELGSSIKEGVTSAIGGLFDGELNFSDWIVSGIMAIGGTEIMNKIFGNGKDDGGAGLPGDNTGAGQLGTMQVMAETVYVTGASQGQNLPALPGPVKKTIPTMLGKLATKLGSGAKTAGGAAIVGGLTVAGTVAAAATTVSAFKDYFHAFQTKDEGKRKELLSKGGSKMGGVISGAAAGATVGALFGGIGVIPGALIGAGIGGVRAMFSKKKPDTDPYKGTYLESIMGPKTKKNKKSYINFFGKRSKKNPYKGTYMETIMGPKTRKDPSKKKSNKKEEKAREKETKQQGLLTKGMELYTDITNDASSFVNNLGVASGMTEGQFSSLGDLIGYTVGNMLGLGDTALSLAQSMNTAMAIISSGGVYGPPAPAKNARGGYIGSHIISELGEDGAEMVIPLTKHRGRALGLWQQAGQMLGVSRESRGGIVGSVRNHTPSDSASTSTGTKIQVGDIKINVNVSGNSGGGSIVEAIKAQKAEIADTIMEAISDACAGYSNRTAEAM